MCNVLATLANAAHALTGRLQLQTAFLNKKQQVGGCIQSQPAAALPSVRWCCSYTRTVSYETFTSWTHAVLTSPGCFCKTRGCVTPFLFHTSPPTNKQRNIDVAPDNRGHQVRPACASIRINNTEPSYYHPNPGLLDIRLLKIGIQE